MQIRWVSALAASRRWLGALLVASSVLPAGAAQRSLVVSELMYSPLADPDGVVPTADFEFIELANISAVPLSLTGAYLTNAITFVFPAGTTIPAGGFLVVPAKRSAFQARYGTSAASTSGFAGKLSDQGDSVELIGANGAVILRFTYDSSDDWPSRANGLGSSLELVDPEGNLDEPANWRSSTEYQGSPGRAGIGPLKQIVINELMAHTDPPFEDAIELHNVTATAINVGGWYLSDNRENPRKFRIPAGTSIAAHGYKVFYELAGTGSPLGFNPDGTGNSPSFTLNSARGDEACLVSTDASGNLQFWMDAVTFGATANGQALGRFPNGTGRLTTVSRQTLGTDVEASFPETFLNVFRTGQGASNAYPKVGPVSFSRIMYHPPDGQDEFIELQNAANTAVALYDPAYPENTWRLRNAVEFDFPADVVLDPGEKVLVVPTEPAAFRAANLIGANIRVFGPWTNLLNNAGETIQLFQPDPPQLPPNPDAGFVPYVLAEEVSYSPAPPWPTAADGMGPALRRKGLGLFGNDPTSWEAEPPSPTAPVVLASRAGTSLSLGFTAQAGRTYRLQRRPSLAGGAWDGGQVLVTPANGGPSSATVLPAAAGVEFYRITVE